MEPTMTWIAVAVGGALGSVARHGVNVLVQSRWPFQRFPVATLVVNVLGCFAIGLLAGLIATEKIHLRLPWREFVFVGLLGGFTTFSSFGLDTLTLARGGAPALALLNVTLQVSIGLSAAYAGFAAGR
jgi:fluoride exporter